MSIVLLLLFAGALFAMEYYRRGGEAFAARLTSSTAGGAEVATFPSRAEAVRTASPERRQGERRHAERRHAA